MKNILGFDSGLLVAVPIPKDKQAETQLIEDATQIALKEMKEKNIHGRDITPFLLKRVNELTKGNSLKSNIVLIKNNAMVGAKLALKLSQNNKNNNKNKNKDCVIFGGMMLDVLAYPNKNIEFTNETSNPGIVKYNFGGVGRNISECMARLDYPPTLISCVGNDLIGQTILKYSNDLGIDVSKCFINDKNTHHNTSTNSYVAVLNKNNDIHCAICEIDLSLLENDIVDPNRYNYYSNIIKQAKIVVLDGNLNTNTLKYLLSICIKYDVDVWYETISIAKSTKIIDDNKCLTGVTYISPNEIELFELLKATNYAHPIITTNTDINSLKQYITHLIQKGVHNVILSRGNKGVLIGSNINNNIIFNTVDVNALNSTEICNTNGAGDNLVGGTIVGLLNGHSLINSVKIGVLAANMCLKTHKSVNDSLTYQKISSKL